MENGHFIDNESWDFLEDLVSDSHAVLVMTIKPLNTVTNFPESAKRLTADSQTVKMTLGRNYGLQACPTRIATDFSWAFNFCGLPFAVGFFMFWSNKEKR